MCAHIQSCIILLQVAIKARELMKFSSLATRREVNIERGKRKEIL